MFTTECFEQTDAARWIVSRREAARELSVHPDSVSRQLAAGLAAAVVEWGGRGREMTMSRAQVLRWKGAQACAHGPYLRPCPACALVLEDMVCAGEHLKAARHGILGRCRRPGCAAQRSFSLPCRTVGWDLAALLESARAATSEGRA